MLDIPILAGLLALNTIVAGLGWLACRRAGRHARTAAFASGSCAVSRSVAVAAQQAAQASAETARQHVGRASQAADRTETLAQIAGQNARDAERDAAAARRAAAEAHAALDVTPLYTPQVATTPAPAVEHDLGGEGG